MIRLVLKTFLPRLLIVICVGTHAVALHARTGDSGHHSAERNIQKLADKNPSVRKNAAIRLGELFREKPEDTQKKKESEKAVTALISALEDPERDVRRTAVKSLGKIGDEEVVPVLRDKLEEEKDPRVQIVLVKVLGEFEDVESEDIFIAFSKKGLLPLRIQAIRALGNLHTRSADRIIIKGLNDPIEAIRVVSADICGTNGLAEALPYLKKNCTYSIPEVRISAIEAIGRLGDKRHIKFLGKIRKKEENAAIHKTIADAIEEITRRFSKTLP